MYVHAASFASGLGLDIHIRTTDRFAYSYIGKLIDICQRQLKALQYLSSRRYLTIFFDCCFTTITTTTESATIRIGEDTLEVESFGQYAWNGIDNADLSQTIGLSGFPIIHSSPNPKIEVFDVVIDSYLNITLHTFKDMVYVTITGGDVAHFKDSVGLIGSIDGMMLGRNKTTTFKDPDAFGQEWQVQEEEPMLFRTVRSPQHPMEKCILPAWDAKENRSLRRRLGEDTISQESAEEACSRLEGVSRDNCIYDGKYSWTGYFSLLE